MKRFCTILCGGCNAEVANIRDAFRMPGHSRCAPTFVNPYGFPHITVTVTKLSDCVAYRIEGRATTQHTWFPGWGSFWAQSCKNIIATVFIGVSLRSPAVTRSTAIVCLFYIIVCLAVYYYSFLFKFVITKWPPQTSLKDKLGGVLHLWRDTHLINDSSRKEGLSMWWRLGMQLTGEYTSNDKGIVDCTLASVFVTKMTKNRAPNPWPTL